MLSLALPPQLSKGADGSAKDKSGKLPYECLPEGKNESVSVHLYIYVRAMEVRVHPY